MIKKFICLSALLISTFKFVSAQTEYSVKSPNQELSVKVSVKNNVLFYNVSRKSELVLQNSSLGLVRADGDFSLGLKLISVSKSELVKDSYTLKNGKRLLNNYAANKVVFHLANKPGKKMDVIFQVSNDGVAFRYYFPDGDAGVKNIIEEKTSFHFSTETKAWMQPMSVAKSGWEHTNPSYEEFYEKEISVGTPSPSPAGWVFPALFKYKENWVVVSETGLDEHYCATRLKQNAEDGNYQIGFPDEKETFAGQNVNPESKLPWFTPWRIIAIGSLKTVTESTLGTDLAYPAKKNINPNLFNTGKATWSWIMLKDNSIVYDVQKRYIDFAADMKWEYCLIDVDWDTKIGYEKMGELAAYAKQKNVGLILWYNSSGDWNTVKYTPRNKLLTHENRLKEFGILQKMGIKGIKVDFFGGDGQPMIKYYFEILEDAAKFVLNVKRHGATLPRGWQRTYPNLVTMESIKGMEAVTFEQKNADEEPMHATTIPFTRNVFDPMDFTPMNLTKIPNIKRKTTAAFELALSVVFQSGIQHFAESPDGMAQVPDYVKAYLQGLPSSWTDTRLLDGYPGKFVVMARKANSKWYIAGLNGEANDKTIQLNLKDFGAKKATIFADDSALTSFETKELQLDKTPVEMKAYGGFVIVVE